MPRKDEGATIRKLIKDLQIEFTQILQEVRSEFKADLQAREETYTKDLYKLRMMILRSFQLPDEYIMEATQDIDEKYFDECGILF